MDSPLHSQLYIPPPGPAPPRPSRRAKSSCQNMARGGEEGGGEEGGGEQGGGEEGRGEEGEGEEGEGEEGEGEEGEGAAWHFYRVYIQASPKRASIHLIEYSAFL